MIIELLLGSFIAGGFIIGILIILTQLGSALDPDAKREELRDHNCAKFPYE